MGTSIQIYGTLPGGGGKTQTKNVNITENGQITVSPDEGFDSMTSVGVTTNVQANLQELNVTPTGVEETILPETGHEGFSEVTVQGEENLVAENIKKDVTIYGVTGELESEDKSDYSIVGTTLDVEAQTTIAKGSKIIGIKNDEYVTPTLASTAQQPNIFNVSGDGTVAIGSGGNRADGITDGTELYIYFLENGIFNQDNCYSLIIENIPSQNITSFFYPAINYDGTLAITSNFNNVSQAKSFENVILVIDIDKENKTASYHYTSLNINNVSVPATPSQYYNIDSPRIYIGTITNLQYGGITKEKIIVAPATFHGVNISDDSFYSNFLGDIIFKYNTNGTFDFVGYYNYSGGTTNYGYQVTQDGNDVYWNVNGNLYKYNLINNSKATLSLGSNAYISENAKYYTTYASASSWDHLTLGKINSDFTKTQIRSESISHVGSVNITIPDNEGHFILSAVGNRIYEYNGSSIINKYSMSNNNILSAHWFFNLPKFNCFTDTNYNKIVTYAVVPGTEAEYLISETNSTDCSTPDRIYGIASQDLAVGTRGEARGLFSTFS